MSAAAIRIARSSKRAAVSTCVTADYAIGATARSVMRLVNPRAGSGWGTSDKGFVLEIT